MIKGRFTLPGEAGKEKEIRELAELWGADAVRDSDGTVLSDELIDMGLKVYSTVCLIRMDNEFAKQNKQYLQQIYLSSERYVAVENTLKINIMEKLFAEQFEPNTDIDIKKYWQVMDRTVSAPLGADKWSYSDNVVTIHNAEVWHEYSVTFMAYQLWEPVSMYNHITNGWNEEHKMPVDPVYPQVKQHLLCKFEKWLAEHPKTDVVRFTTFFYCFDLIYDENGRERFVNWFGYGACVSVKMLEMFKVRYGYEMCPEDFIDNYMFNSPFKNPSKRYLDWMEFVSKFVADTAAEFVGLAHKYNKKAIMFLGDHWAGTEPYGKNFAGIGLDAVVGAAGDGVTTRMITDIPINETEVRFYPYLFPDTFYEGGDPVGESKPIWVKCRRALIRSSAQRMGYGGYISLALKFPEFIDHVTEIAEQFKLICRQSDKEKPHTAGFRVAILSSWGKLRSWQCHQVAHSLWRQQCYSYLGILEALAGLPFEVEFISFDDIINNGIDPKTGVIINCGSRATSWSGDTYWSDTAVIKIIRNWVYNGGGFIGVGEPTAFEQNGRLFALDDVLGVQKELGLTGSFNKPNISHEKTHFIMEDTSKVLDYGEEVSFIYKMGNSVVLDARNNSVTLSVNEYGSGRSVYISGLPYNANNSRILHRALCWAAHSEDEFKRYYSDNVNVELHIYEASKKALIVNNTDTDTSANIYIDGVKRQIELRPLECRLIDYRI